MSTLTERRAPVLCLYQNQTPTIEVVRLSPGVAVTLEKVLFPQQQILFEADADDNLEVSNAETSGHLLLQRISCQRLLVQAD